MTEENLIEDYINFGKERNMEDIISLKYPGIKGLKVTTEDEKMMIRFDDTGTPTKTEVEEFLKSIPKKVANMKADDFQLPV